MQGTDSGKPPSFDESGFLMGEPGEPDGTSIGTGAGSS